MERRAAAFVWSCQVQRPYQITALVLFIIAGCILVVALRMHYYTPLGPGPGFFPLWLAILLGGLAVAMGYQATFRALEPQSEDFIVSPEGYVRDGAVIVALIWAVVGIEDVGFIVTMFVFFVFLLVTLGRQRWFLTIVISGIGSFGTDYVFQNFLSIPLPRGIMPQWYGIG